MTYPGFDRITSDPAILGGKPCVRGMRLSVQRVLEIVAAYSDRAAIRADFPELEDEDIRQALRFAAGLIEDRMFPLDLTAV
jgi:uncharacterized protein (DUF433 family)